MGMYDDDGFEDEYEDTSRGPKELREAQKAAAKRAKELEAENQKLREQIASRNLKDVLEDKGLRPGLARVISRENVDLTDPKAIQAWLESPENQEDFAFSLKEDESSEGDGEGAEGIDSEYAQQYTRMQGASNGALPDDKLSQARSQIKAAKTTAERQAALNRVIGNI